jgi:putative transposase
VGLLALRPSELLTILKMASSIGYRRSVSLLSAIQATGLLTFTPVGLPPTKHASLRWTRDFFTVPTVTFQLLYCFFVIEHGRRKILHCNVTRHPTADWVIQQLRETFPEAAPYRYVILDRDAKFDEGVIGFLKATGLRPKRTSTQSPWQNGIAERWIGSCRREMLDHVIVLNDRHLRRLMSEYISYHQQDRVHDSLAKDTPDKRPIEQRPEANATVVGMPRLGGLHHRYAWRVAA